MPQSAIFSDSTRSRWLSGPAAVLLTGLLLFLLTWFAWGWRYSHGGEVAIEGAGGASALAGDVAAIEPLRSGPGFREYKLRVDPATEGIWVRATTGGKGLVKGEELWQAGNIFIEPRDAAGNRLSPNAGIAGSATDDFRSSTAITSLAKLPRPAHWFLRFENRAPEGTFVTRSLELLPVTQRSTWIFVAIGLVGLWLAWLAWMVAMVFPDSLRRFFLPPALLAVAWLTILPGPWGGWRGLAGADLYLFSGFNQPDPGQPLLWENIVIGERVAAEADYAPTDGNYLMEFILWAKQSPVLLHLGTYFAVGLGVSLIIFAPEFLAHTRRYRSSGLTPTQCRRNLYAPTLAILFSLCLLPEITQILFFGAPSAHDLIDLLCNTTAALLAYAIVLQSCKALSQKSLR